MLNKENEANVLTIAFGHILYILNPVLGEFIFFFFNDTAPTEIYTSLHTLSLHDALPIFLSGTARRVPWGRAVERVVALVDGQAVVIRTAVATAVERRTNLAGEPRDTLVFERARVEEVRPAACDLNERGALTRVALMAGALVAMARLTIHYAGERR